MNARAATLLATFTLAACGGAPGADRAASPADHLQATDGVHGARQVTVAGALLPPMPVAVTSFGAATDGTYLYALGGYYGTPHAYSREGQSRSLYRVPVDGSAPWEEVGRMDVGLQGLALVAHGRRLCRAGGNTVENAEGEPARLRSVADAACLEPGSSWQPLPPLPSGRSSHGAALVGDTLYVAGGWQLDGGPETGRFHDTMLALDLTSPESGWRRIDAPFTRRAIGMASAAGRVIVIGGLDAQRSVSRRVDVYDPASGQWSQGPEYPSDAFGVAAVGIGDAVLASARDGVVYRWRIGEPAWERVASLAFPRFFHQLVALPDGSVVALGGIGGMHTHGRTRHVERIEPEAGEPSLAYWTMPYPGAAKNRQAIFVHDDFLYLFGGNDSLEQHDFEPENFESEGWRLHIPSMRWERIADFPARRQSMMTVLAGDRAIVVGGFGHDGRAAVTQTDAYVFDVARGTWSERAGLPSGGRTQFSLTAHGDSLVILGGLDYDPARGGEAAFHHATSILTASTNDPTVPFAQLEDVEMPGPRRAFAGAALGDRIYIVGGMRDGFQPVDDCVVFDVTARSFAPIACPRATRISGEMVALGERLYLAAGSVRKEDGLAADRSIERYDPSTDRWDLLVAELPFDTRHARMLAYRDRLLVVSTHNDEGRILLALVRP